MYFERNVIELIFVWCCVVFVHLFTRSPDKVTALKTAMHVDYCWFLFVIFPHSYYL